LSKEAEKWLSILPGEMDLKFRVFTKTDTGGEIPRRETEQYERKKKRE
jgi:hypothetical protein